MFYDGHLTKSHSAYMGTWHIRKASSNIYKTLERVSHSKLDSKRKLNMWQHKLIVIKIDMPIINLLYRNFTLFKVWNQK